MRSESHDRIVGHCIHDCEVTGLDSTYEARLNDHEARLNYLDSLTNDST